MTPTELQNALNEFAKGVSPKADIFIYVKTGSGSPLAVSLYPKGIGADERMAVDAAHWLDVIPAISAAWEERRATSERETTRRMALAIIRITADCDGCSDAALRADNFDDSEIAALGAAAIEVANEMAANGPFSIVPVAQSNAMAAE